MNHAHMAGLDHGDVPIRTMIADFLRRFRVCLVLSVPGV